MKKLIVLFLFISTAVLAQRPPKMDDERIASAKIGLITERLNLSSSQAPQFWSVYNEYAKKRKVIMHSMRRKVDDVEVMTSSDEQVLAGIREVMDLRQKEIDLEKDYMPKFLKVISVKQYAELLRTERKFNQMLLQRLKEKANEK